MDFTPNWQPPTDQPRLDIAQAVVNEAIRLVSEQTPDLLEIFPFQHSRHVQIHIDNEWIGILLEFFLSPGIPSIGELDANNLNVFRTAAERTLTGSFTKLVATLGEDFFSFTKFSYVGPHQNGKISWPHLVTHLVGWMNQYVLPEVLRRNEARVLRAIPSPPQIGIGRASRALWILECEESIRQGSAFSLAGYGVITCDHVLGPRTTAFRADAPSKKSAVTVISREPAIDLAILKVEGSVDEGLEFGSADGLKQMDHVVIFGFPNYRVGDTGTVVPGLVVGFRTVSGIRRILTNAPIIGGTSGGPVLDATGKVVGIAVTGADQMETAQATENHGIIPVDALRFLLRI